MTFATRRARNAMIASLLLLLAWGIHSAVDVSLRSTALWSGSLLLCLRILHLQYRIIVDHIGRKLAVHVQRGVGYTVAHRTPCQYVLDAVAVQRYGREPVPQKVKQHLANVIHIVLQFAGPVTYGL